MASDDNPLQGLVDLMEEAGKFAETIREPINTVSSGLQEAQKDVTSVDNFIGDLRAFISTLNEVGDACYLLTEVPVVGEIMDEVGIALRKFSEVVNEIVTPIYEFKKTVLDEVKSALQKINDILGRVAEYINFFSDK